METQHHHLLTKILIGVVVVAVVAGLVYALKG